MENIKAQMREKIEILNRAAKAYYQDAEEIMSNYDYDKLYDELLQLENAPSPMNVTLLGIFILVKLAQR